MTAEEFKRRRDIIEKGLDSDEEMFLKKRKPKQNKELDSKQAKLIKKKKRKLAKLSFLDSEEEQGKELLLNMVC